MVSAGDEQKLIRLNLIDNVDKISNDPLGNTITIIILKFYYADMHCVHRIMHCFYNVE